MPFAKLKLPDTYWTQLEINDEDLEFLYNYLLEIETPQTSKELASVLIQGRIQKERELLESRQSESGGFYIPSASYSIGEKIIFPQLESAEGTVTNIRPGNNPDLPAFNVIEIDFGAGGIRNFAADLEEHVLNNPAEGDLADPNLDPNFVLENFDTCIVKCLTDMFQTQADLVQIAGAWFPKSLLVDVNIGYLNLAEAVLEMTEGGPLTTAEIVEQIELPTDANPKLTEFSMNYALQEDQRFDEVGPSGKTLWFLRRLEPESVQETPIFLRYQAPEVDKTGIEDEIDALNALVYDELEPDGDLPTKADEIEVSLIYPHWRSGTLPLSKSIARLFPTAYESPRVRFTFVDFETGKQYSGWVVRPEKYVYGLQEWYAEKNLLPGSLFRIKKGAVPGEVIIQAANKKPTKEWVRTILVGADNGFVFTMLKQLIASDFDDRMVTFIPDSKALDKIWELSNRQRGTLENNVMNVMRELVKLSPQGHVHAQELYAAVNIVRRCPPGMIINVLANQPNVIHMGDLHFRIREQDEE
ncbi:MAG TPA: hypothetical protein PKD23_04490 [Bellilinea sp.]|jgi:hypothetical protein|nr:hypothetical protein [Bellilinea sp.]